MDLHEIIDNKDGTYAATYSMDMVDVNGAVCKIPCSTVRRSKGELQLAIDNQKAQIAGFQSNLDVLIAEQNALLKLG